MPTPRLSYSLQARARRRARIANASIFREIVPEIVHHAPNAILFIATNPVDPLTYAAWKFSGLPLNRVIGSGTILDSARFRYLLGQHFGINPQSVHAYVISEHGDSEVPVWSLANIAGIHLRAFCEHEAIAWDERELETIFCEARNAAYEIIDSAEFRAFAGAAFRCATHYLPR